MSWKDQLRPASFRGVPFRVVDSDTLFGRRNELHEYPLRDEPYAEDLGKKAREYSFNAFVIGDDYLGARDALISAIEDNKSPGTLIHPTLGSKTVIPKDCRVIYSNQEGGLERFVLTFVEAGQANFPSSLANTQGLVDSLSSSAISAMINGFASVYSVASLPDYISSASNSLSSSFLTSLTGALSVGVPNATNYTSFMSLFNTFNSGYSSQASSGETLATSVTGLTSGLSGVYDSSTDAYKAQKQLLTYGNSFQSVPTNTQTRQQQALNQEAYTNLVKNSAAVEMARATSEMDFASRQDAIKYRNEVDAILDSRMLAMADSTSDIDPDDAQYIALSKLRAAVVKDINRRGAQLPNARTVRTADSVPALVFAYNTYEDASKDAEVIERNKIRNPVFLPPDSDIEILI